jgi:hypothetical protein
MRIEVSKGELIDKITILEIKDERMKDEEKLKNIRHELDVLQKYEFETSLKEDLKQVNNTIWDLEDGIRNLEKVEDFGTDFIDKARNIYKFNDERARIKKLINLEQGSDIVEEKSY